MSFLELVIQYIQKKEEVCHKIQEFLPLGLNLYCLPKYQHDYFFLSFPVVAVQPINNVVIVSGEQQRDSAMCTHISTLPQTPLPSRLPHNIEQSSMCHTAEEIISHHAAFWLPIQESKHLIHLVPSMCLWDMGSVSRVEGLQH